MTKSNPTTIVSLMNTKGGTGKSTIIQLICTHFNYYNPNANIKLVDADAGTKTSIHLRKDDMAIVEEYLVKYPNSKVSKLYKELAEANSVYPIVQVSPQELKKEIEASSKANYPYDFLFIDTPGSYTSEAFQTSLAVCNYILIPTKPYEKEIVASVDLYIKIEKLKKEGNLPNLQYFTLFINDAAAFINVNDVVDRIDYTYLRLLQQAGESKTNSDINIMNNIVPRKNEVAQSILTSIIPLVPENKNTHFLSDFMEEISKIIPNLK